MTDLMTPIYDTIPGYREARDSLVTLDGIPMPVTSGALTPAQHLATDLLAHLADDKPFNLLDRAAAAMTEIGRVEVARHALVQAREQVNARLRELKASNPDVILSGLNAALTELVDEVRAMQPLDEVTTEAGAIASDRTTDHKRLRAIAPSYTEIRREQLATMRDHAGDELATPEVLFARNIPEHFPLWAPWRTHGFLQQETGNATRNIRPPWPVEDDPRSHDLSPLSRQNFEKDASTPAFLYWAVEAGVALWVPTLAQYAEAAGEHYELLDREHRTEVIDGKWIDPGGVDLGTPSRGLSNSIEARQAKHAIAMAER